MVARGAGAVTCTCCGSTGEHRVVVLAPAGDSGSEIPGAVVMMKCAQCEGTGVRKHNLAEPVT